MINIFELIALLSGIYIAFVIGANDTANALGTSVGANLMDYKKLVLVFGIFVLLGCLNAHKVGHTVGSIVSGNTVLPLVIAGLIITIITYKKIPISTHQVIVCALVGLNMSSADMGLFIKIIGSWVISPILTALISFTLYKLFEHSDIPVLKRVELIKYGLIISGGLIAYNLGSNDLPTALGAISNSTYVFFMGGIALITGALLFGKGVSETVGINIVKLNPLAAFVAQLSAGIGVFVFTQFGMPVSTTQAIIGGVVGVGLTKGIKTVKWKTLRNVILGWVSAPGFALIVGYLIEIIKFR
ncbi:inorganic phosphate transporter [Methanothermococcus okinawensis]|uniref:Phosphate transporter n=1 Tax=Methanothermococcus okinawensis (strain DSM 14208 / JCM 11175 / IH1) TaxID=647113 RepID=F8ANV6_METOI|nr:inorganic phosphate transporter [Methanothermococcus okinawensis]AEH07097.1 phosphate transporter [Methanothermococcus okinawensis IH1]